MPVIGKISIITFLLFSSLFPGIPLKKESSLLYTCPLNHHFLRLHVFTAYTGVARIIAPGVHSAMDAHRIFIHRWAN